MANLLWANTYVSGYVVSQMGLGFKILINVDLVRGPKPLLIA